MGEDRESHEDSERRRMIAKLFALFRERDAALAEVYVEETRSIPLVFLSRALRVVVRRYRWPTLPRIGDIWTVAKEIAGMSREQYRSGRYIAAPSEWPPDGTRHSIHAGQWEPLPPLDAPIALPATERVLALAQGEIAQDEVFD
jgi:hypothetical protein